MGESERDVPNVHCVLHCVLHCILQCALCTARPVTRSKSQDPCLMARSLVICNRSRCFYERCKGPERQRCNKSLTPSHRPSLLIVRDATTHISRYKYITVIQKKQQRNQEKTIKQTLHLLLLPEANGWQPVLCFPHTLGGLRALPERLATLPRKLSQITSFANHYNQYRERSSIYNNTK